MVYRSAARLTVPLSGVRLRDGKRGQTFDALESAVFEGGLGLLELRLTGGPFTFSVATSGPPFGLRHGRTMRDMTTDAPPAPTEPTPAPAQQPPRRRTRPPDWMTDVVLVLTAFVGVWALALIVLTIVGITQPALIYSDPKAAIKALGATVVALLALGQAYTMHAAMGHLPRGRFKIRSLTRVHRIAGRIAIVLAVLVAWFCIVDVGAPTSPLRVAIHAIAGSTAFALLAIKFTLIRFRPHVAYDLAPWLGGGAAAAFVVIWITSGLAYLTGNL
jgi:hypothetical protein